MWLTLRIMGPAKLGEAFDSLITLTQATHQLLKAHPVIEVLHAPELTTQIFRFVPRPGMNPVQLDAINAGIRKALFRSGNAVIAGTKVDGRQYLKFTLLNPTTSLADMEDVIALIAHYGREQARDMTLQVANQ